MQPQPRLIALGLAALLVTACTGSGATPSPTAQPSSAAAPAATAPASVAPTTDFPTKGITYISTFGPGGGSDKYARRQQPLLEALLGQPVTIDYKEGAGGAVGWGEVAKMPADGYTWTVGSLPHNVVQPMQPDALYRTEDLEQIAITEATPLLFVVPNDSPYQSVEDFVAGAKANPATLTIGGTGQFTSVHLSTLRFQKAADIQLEYVSFSGGAEQTTAFLGNQIDAIFVHTGDFAPYKDAGRVLAITTEERFSAYPDTPTFGELGFDVVQLTERSVAVPAGVPDEVAAAIEAAVLEVTKDPGLIADETAGGNIVLNMGREEAAAHVAELQAEYESLLADLLP